MKFLIPFISIVLILFCASAIANSEYKDYEVKVQEGFKNLSIEYDKYISKKSGRDILDPDFVDDTKWKTELENIINIYLDQPDGYLEDRFWTVGTRSIVKVGFSLDGFENQTPHQNLSRMDAIRTAIEATDLASEFLIESQFKVNGQAEIGMFVAACTIPPIIKALKALTTTLYLEKSKVASIFLDSLRNDVRLLSDRDQKLIVTDPVMKELISIIKTIEKTNKWPYEQEAHY